MRRELHFGDNLEVLRDRKFFPDESIDLIYLDPPFNSSASYNMLFKDKSGDTSEAQIQAFDDTWVWGITAERALHDIMSREDVPIKLQQLMPALKSFLGLNDMMAYLAMMAVRLVELHRVLKDTGSLYLHCDPTASHYLKLVLDAVFGVEFFLNEIIWQRSTGKSNSSRKFPTNHDSILSVSKSGKHTWNKNQLYIPYDQNKLPEKTEIKYSHKDEDGRLYRLDNLLNPNKNRPNLTYEFLGVTRVWRWTKERMKRANDDGLIVQTAPGRVPQFKRYLDEQAGIPIDDLWLDIPPLNSQAKERLGYPTQKPLALLERVIAASSNSGDIVLDPFCGCGTAVDAAEKLGRQWVGIDVTHLAIGLIERRMKDRYAELKAKGAYKVYGTPTTVKAAQRLFEESPMQFERWAISLIPGAREYKLGGGDGGIDGMLYFQNEDGEYKQGLFSVKGGKTLNPAMVRDFRGTIERETNAEFGIFICLHGPTKGMLTEAATAGFYKNAGKEIPRLQIATIKDLLAGKLPERPRLVDESAVFKKASRQIKSDGQGTLL
ncbi:MAG: restriction endonuclease subunit M [Robiginitomaculum sp.]|nr:MAG: restriction endonuclease subunit M [Robiginitomaculum sp.]